MNILKIKGKDGNWIGIDAIAGEGGKSAYEQAREGGFLGTEEDFISALNDLEKMREDINYLMEIIKGSEGNS